MDIAQPGIWAVQSHSSLLRHTGTTPPTRNAGLTGGSGAVPAAATSRPRLNFTIRLSSLKKPSLKKPSSSERQRLSRKNTYRGSVGKTATLQLLIQLPKRLMIDSC